MEFLQHNINQSETRICDNRSSVELYVRVKQSMWHMFEFENDKIYTAAELILLASSV